MSKSARNIFLNLLILLYFIFQSYSFEILENDMKLPIAKIALNGNNLGEIEKIIISKLVSEKKTLPPFYLSEDIPFLGNISLNLSDNILTISNQSEANIEFVKEDNLNIITNNIKGEITFNYKFNSKIIESEGNGTILINNIYMKINNKIVQISNTYEPEKKIPGIQIDSIQIDDIELKFYFSKTGTIEKLIKYFYKNLKHYILNVLNIDIEKQQVIQKVNQRLKNIFENFNLNIPINLKDVDQKLNFSFSFNEKPLIQNNFLELSLEGEIKGDNYMYDKINNISLPCIINNATLISNYSINSIISQFIFNNVLDSLYYFGKFNLEITNDTMNISELNVGAISLIISELTPKYKTSQKMKIITSAITSPILNIKSNNILKLNLDENIKIFIYNEASYVNDLGEIAIDADSRLDIIAEFYSNDKEMKLKINSISMLNFDVKKSLVGEINTTDLITRFNYFSNMLFLSQINNKIKTIIEDLRKKFINYKGINISNIYTKTFENFIKVDISPILVSLFDIIYY